MISLRQRKNDICLQSHTPDMSKSIKNEQWTVKHLISLIVAGVIVKPKYQRKKKWDVLPKKDKVPNERNYILFLYETNNSVHAITFGENADKTYTNIDGNNRINAIHHFLDKPFDLFPEYLQDINALIDIKLQDNEVNSVVKGIFANISYNSLMKFKYNSYFDDNLYQTHLKILRDEFEVCIETLQNKLKINGQDYFDSDVKINVNIFQGYSTNELCQVFENINKYNTVLSEDELLACILYNVSDFKITDSLIETAIKEELVNLYKYKSANETLNCYQYDKEEMNAYDFLYGFQNYAHSKCSMIEDVSNNKEGASLFYKIYNLLYHDDNIFTTANVNEFIKKMLNVIDILNATLYDKLIYADDCNKKIQGLKKNNVFIIIACVLGFIEMQTSAKDIQSSISKCILYHLFVKDISDKKIREDFAKDDELKYNAGGCYIESKCLALYKDPYKISADISRDVLEKVLTYLCAEKNKPANTAPGTRRKRKFFEKVLIHHYYRCSVPTSMLNHTFSMEHIFPFSCKWDGEIDIDRLGNIIPIISKLNCKRGNKSIAEYKKYDTNNFIQYLSDIIPSEEVYEDVCSTNIIKNTEVYIQLCEANEERYISNFMNAFR